MTDTQVRDAVIEELRFDPRIQAAHIGVSAKGGVVTLSGHINNFAQKAAAIVAARRIKGVSAVADELEVLFPEDKKTADDEIARRVIEAIRWDEMLPPTINITVRHGLVMLSGEVQWFYQRLVAEENVQKIAGVKGIINKIKIAPTVAASSIQNEIERALLRSAEVEAKQIQVRVADGSHVILDGTVRNWNERTAVENAAWCVPGVKAVENKLKVSPMIYFQDT